MNEIFFLLHIITVIAFVLGSLAIGQHALISCICLQAVLANLFVVKQITLFDLNVTTSDVFIVGGVLGLNLLQEYFGKQIVKKTIWISFFIMLFYVAMTQFQLLYVPNSFDKTHQMFAGILQFMPRITIASLIVYLIVQRVDCWLYGLLKGRFENKFLVGRNIFSIITTQFLDTVLFSFLGLYGIVGSVLNIIVMSFLIKVCVILIATPFVGLSRKIVKQASSLKAASLRNPAKPGRRRKK